MAEILRFPIGKTPRDDWFKSNTDWLAEYLIKAGYAQADESGRRFAAIWAATYVSHFTTLYPDLKVLLKDEAVLENVLNLFQSSWLKGLSKLVVTEGKPSGPA